MTISATNQTQLESSHTNRIYFIFMDFAGDPLYACTGNKSYTFQSQSWLGIGEISGISDLGEAADIAARPITLTISGVDSWITTPLLSRTNYKGAAVEIYRGLLDSDGDLVDDPWCVWKGRMDVGSISYDETYTGTMVCEPQAAQLLRPNISRYSNEDHHLRHSGDNFYEFLSQMESKDVTWGGQRVAPGTGGAGGSGDSGRFTRSRPR